MKVLMLGWEYPPHLSGGLGTACAGLTKALAARHVALDFVVPRVFGDEESGHMNLMAAQRPVTMGSSNIDASVATVIRPIFVESWLSPYARPNDPAGYSASDSHALPVSRRSVTTHRQSSGWALFDEVANYTEDLLTRAWDSDYDLIHGHDWMTYQAAIALGRMLGLPVILHLHSLEVDRSGHGANPTIEAIERFGVRAADRVIAVSHFTKQLACERYGVEPTKVDVVHNGAMGALDVPSVEVARPVRNAHEKTVLFLGRVTFQKGPDYFVEAAAEVVAYRPNTRFIMVGSGDMLQRLQSRVHELGIGGQFEFPGFLRGRQVDEAFAAADLYVMPSVSEPFGLTVLEAIKAGTPVIISRTAGVNEVVRHALRVDFWDVKELASLMIGVLEDSVVGEEMVPRAQREIENLTWGRAAERVQQIYEDLLTTGAHGAQRANASP